MNKRITAILAIIMIASTGCQMFKSDPERRGYRTGHTLATTHILTEDYQPDGMQKGITAAYQVAKLVVGSGATPDDGQITTLIAELYPDMSPEDSKIVFALYVMARSEVRAQIGAHPDTAAATIITNFMEGIADALEEWDVYRQSKPGVE